MHNRDYKDLTSAVTLILLGGATTLYSISHYALGTLRQLGPGAFPAFLGSLLIVFGIIIGLPALRRAGDVPEFELVPFLSVVLGVIAFGITIEPLGLIPAILILTTISTAAEKRLSHLQKLALVIVLAAGSTVIFTVGLDLPFQIAKWPF